MKIKILVVVGKDIGTEYLLDHLPVSIGRALDNDVIINDPHVSRTHCTIYSDDKLFFISDLNSTNKTYLNDKEVRLPKIINDNDIMAIGKTYIRFSFIK